ncbi:uncharacterized protein LOC142765085 [Rhipicephalus microplus]|uniref:uncharacterized protein LOC142765085 n=1 Tax=Rhipicephalus microplus TaxID=6941 RepID=UPI003F6C8BC6
MSAEAACVFQKRPLFDRLPCTSNMRSFGLVVAAILVVTVCSDFADSNRSTLKEIPYWRLRSYATQLALMSSKSYARRLTEIIKTERDGDHLAILFEAVETTCKQIRKLLSSPAYCPVRENSSVFHCAGIVELRGNSFDRAKLPEKVFCRNVHDH